MAGLIWTIQILHYPFFHHLEKESFVKHMKVHRTRISFIVIPIMLIELFTGLYLCLYTAYNSVLFWVGFFMILLIWLSTFLLQMPRHNQILHQYQPTAVESLISTNWIRTILWTLRVFLLLYISLTVLPAV